MFDFMALILNPLNNIPSIITLFKSLILESGSFKKDLKCWFTYLTKSSLEKLGTSNNTLKRSISVLIKSLINMFITFYVGSLGFIN